MTELNSSHLLSEGNSSCLLRLGDLLLRYQLNPVTGAVEFLPVPANASDRIVERQRMRPSHPLFEKEDRVDFMPENETDSIAQVGIRHLPAPGMWRTGESMRNGLATESLVFVRQTMDREGSTTRIRTALRSPYGFEVCQTVEHTVSAPGVIVSTEIRNLRKELLPVELLSSFSLSGITPFAKDDAPGRLKVHRFRSAWSNEAKHEARWIEDLHLERTWTNGPVSERFGQNGSLPVRGFHPFVGVEDSDAGVIWGAQLIWHGSWEMEIYRRDDGLCLSGGLGGYERAHWMKMLEPDESFESPAVLVTACEGDLDALCRRLVRMQAYFDHEEPEGEKDLPIVFNEWCSSWGNPTHEAIVKTAERLQGTETRYLVIDDGWAERPEGEGFQFNGDWNLNRIAFPKGMAETTQAIRDRGLVPGIWFEFEICTEGTEAFSLTDHHLKRHGTVLQVGKRRFWDFRDPWTFRYLEEKVIRFLKENGFGYLKVDYNESIGLGCDGAESLGEGLRQHLLKVKEFFEKIRREVPGIMIENCASGGHRIEPGMVGLTTMSSFSDAHETVEIPIIAAQLNRLAPARKLQVWAVLRPDDSTQRLHYSLAATFLGRMCISGDVIELPEDSFTIMREAQAFYRRVAPIIRDGDVRVIDQLGPSRRYPEGWQCVLRSSERQMLIVLHAFDLNEKSITVSIELPEASSWEIIECLGAPRDPQLSGIALRLTDLTSFSGSVILLEHD